MSTPDCFGSMDGPELARTRAAVAKVVRTFYFQPQCDRCGYRGSLYAKPADAELVVKDHNHRRHSTP